MPHLSLQGVCKRFGALKVADEVSFDVAAGETLGILGPNGAGKTTLFNLVTGDLRLDGGRIAFEGSDISQLRPHERCRLGIGRTYQVPQPFVNMSVFENLVTAACFGGGETEKAAWETSFEILGQTGLLRHADRLAGSLGLLDRKRLELARALATRPTLLLLDEIAGGLTEHEARALVDELQRIKSAGVTMVWIEHVVHALLAIADRLFVLDAGRRLADGPPREVMASPEVRRVYMGMDVEAEAA